MHVRTEPLVWISLEITAVIVNQDILATTAKHLTNDCLLTFLNLKRLRKKVYFFGNYNMKILIPILMFKISINARPTHVRMEPLVWI